MFYDRGMVDDSTIQSSFQFLIMTLLGPSLAELRRLFPESKLSSIDVALVGIQAVESIHDIHLISYFHRDIK